MRWNATRAMRRGAGCTRVERGGRPGDGSWALRRRPLPPAASGRLLVGFRKGVPKDRQQRLLAALDGLVAQRFRAIRGGRLVVVRPRSGRATNALRRRLVRLPEVAYAEPDFLQFASQARTPDDPFYSLE
jgi:hypothetical protein